MNGPATAEQHQDSGQAARHAGGRRAGTFDYEWLGLAMASTMFVGGALPPALLERIFMLRCRFRELTGLPCPSCGGTRCVQAFVRGDWSLAWTMNPLVFVFTLTAATFVLYAVAAIATGRRWRPRQVNRPRRLVAAMLATAGLLFLLNWIYLVRVGR